jgi:hypothetical protein
MGRQESRIEVWSSGALATENTIFFKSPHSEKVYLVYKSQKTPLSTINVGEAWQGEFRVSMPGSYSLQIGKHMHELQIAQYQRFNMGFELGLTALAVAAFFVVLYFKKRARV